jgi:hypothetical protein
MVLAMAMVAAPAYAQLNGENLLGDMGVKSGSQPAPGFYLGNVYYRYGSDTIRDPDGRSLGLDPTGEARQTIQAAVPMAIYITKKKVLGAHFGMMAVMPFATGSLEAPGFGVSDSASIGASDIYVMPAQLGWRGRKFDATIGFAFFAPTGRHTAGADDNLGKGMWSYELSGGTTFYFDEARSFSVAAAAYWETHTKKDGAIAVEGLTLHDVKVGQLMTTEGGVGKSFLQGAASVGMAYYAQWKLTDDEFAVSGLTPSVKDRHRVFGLGPDVTIPIATRTKLLALVNVRYLLETGAQTKTQGQSLVVTTTFPVGGIKIAR